MTAVAIMQPTYLSWLGYFDLLDQADHFVFLDTVQLNTRSWQTRNRITTPDGNTVWLSVPVHATRDQTIRDTRIDNTQHWQRKHLGTIRNAYQHAPYYDDLDQLLHPLRYEWNRLGALTCTLVYDIAHYLGITTPLSAASALPNVSTDRVQRLTDICHHLNADTLIEPTGGTYLRDQPLPIAVQWHDYNHPIYSRDGQPFHPYLSIIDLIAWHGPHSLAILTQQQAVAA